MHLAAELQNSLKIWQDCNEELTDPHSDQRIFMPPLWVIDSTSTKTISKYLEDSHITISENVMFIGYTT